jgi:hypothetical protein
MRKTAYLIMAVTVDTFWKEFCTSVGHNFFWIFWMLEKLKKWCKRNEILPIKVSHYDVIISHHCGSLSAMLLAGVSAVLAWPLMVQVGPRGYFYFMFQHLHQYWNWVAARNGSLMDE